MGNLPSINEARERAQSFRKAQSDQQTNALGALEEALQNEADEQIARLGALIIETSGNGGVRAHIDYSVRINRTRIPLDETEALIIFADAVAKRIVSACHEQGYTSVADRASEQRDFRDNVDAPPTYYDHTITVMWPTEE